MNCGDSPFLAISNLVLVKGVHNLIRSKDLSVFDTSLLGHLP